MVLVSIAEAGSVGFLLPEGTFEKNPLEPVASPSCSCW